MKAVWYEANGAAEDVLVHGDMGMRHRRIVKFWSGCTRLASILLM